MMYKVVFEYDDGSSDFFIVNSLSDALEYEADENYACIESFV